MPKSKCPADNHHWVTFQSVAGLENSGKAVVCTICATVGMLQMVDGSVIVDPDMMKPISEFANSMTAAIQSKKV